MNNDDKQEKKADKKTVTPRKSAKKPNDDFKRKYFEFYDDIKISDRQDW